ncbi:MAG: hypothetical protein J7L21_04395 [Sulfurimonas sp.]|nr:hypothetical protein [Sulfurimonas sp.]
MFRNIKSVLMGLVVISLMVGCGGPPAPSSSEKNVVLSSDAKTVYINSKATFTGAVASNIKAECQIDTQVMTWIKNYSAKHNINVIIGGKPSATESVLKISITDAVSSGNMAVGHNKFITISGKLYKGKKLTSSFKASRRSGGGYFGGYRGSCSVLGSCAKTLGKDTALWLANPIDKSRLGDAYLIK